MAIYRINYQVCDGCMRRTCKSSILKCLTLSAVSLCLIQTSTAETNLNVDLEISLALRQEFVSKELVIQQSRKSINDKQSLVAKLFNQLDAAIISDDQYKIQSLLNELTIQLEQLQKHLSEQDTNLERYRSFVYRLLSSSARKEPSIAKQPMNNEWQSMARLMFEEMSPQDRVVKASKLKSILNARKELNDLDKFDSNRLRAPYSNVASLIEKHDRALLDRIYIEIKKAHCQRLEDIVYNVIGLYRNKEFKSEEFRQDDYDELQRGINNILMDFPEKMPIENPYSTFEAKVAQ